MDRLHVLLAHALHDVTRRIGESPVLWADLLRVIPDEGISLADLPAAARVSRRATKSLVGLRNGLVSVSGKDVSLTASGRAARESWGAKVGAVDSPSWRVPLVDLVARFDLEFAWYPVPYGTADASVAGGRARAAVEGPPRVPPHGTDWVPVPRTDPTAVRSMPLLALVSQALLAYSIDYEELLGFPMRWSAVICRTFPSGHAPFASVSPLLHVAGNGKSALERHGVVRVTDGVAALTPVGMQIRDNHERALDRVDSIWETRYGAATVGAVRDALGSVPADGVPDEVHVDWIVGRGFTDVSYQGA